MDTWKLGFVFHLFFSVQQRNSLAKTWRKKVTNIYWLLTRTDELNWRLFSSLFGWWRSDFYLFVEIKASWTELEFSLWCDVMLSSPTICWYHTITWVLGGVVTEYSNLDFFISGEETSSSSSSLWSHMFFLQIRLLSRTAMVGPEPSGRLWQSSLELQPLSPPVLLW